MQPPARKKTSDLVKICYCFRVLVAEFISPQKFYTFSFIVGNIIPKSVKCIHSATMGLRVSREEFIGFQGLGPLGFRACAFRTVS